MPDWIHVPVAATASQLADRFREEILAALHDVPRGVSTTDVHARMIANGLPVARSTVEWWLRVLRDEHKIALGSHGRWVATDRILTWEKPPQAQSHEEWASYQADGAPPGTYAPNMGKDWMLRWKAKMAGQRSAGLQDLHVVIRKTVIGRDRPNYAQVVFVVHRDGDVRQSMNGPALWSEQEFAELPRAIEEAREAMAAYARSHGESPE